jgi:hypothetical protein
MTTFMVMALSTCGSGAQERNDQRCANGMEVVSVHVNPNKQLTGGAGRGWW